MYKPIHTCTYTHANRNASHAYTHIERIYTCARYYIHMYALDAYTHACIALHTCTRCITYIQSLHNRTNAHYINIYIHTCIARIHANEHAYIHDMHYNTSNAIANVHPYVHCMHATYQIMYMQGIAPHDIILNHTYLQYTYTSHTHTHIHTYIHSYIHTYIHTYIHYTRKRNALHACMHTCIHYIHKYIHTSRTCIRTNTYIQRTCISSHHITLHHVTLHCMLTYIHYMHKCIHYIHARIACTDALHTLHCATWHCVTNTHVLNTKIT